MKLFYAPGACSIGIHVLMEEIGKPYEGVAVNLREGAQYKPDFTLVNSKSKVPTVVDDAGTVRT
jgi:glutathione S-transferase